MFTARRLFKNLSALALISALPFLFSGAASAQTCDVDMISYWKLDEDTTGTYSDSSSGSNTAYCVTDCPSPSITGIINVNGSQEFDGSDEVNVTDDGTFDWGADDSFSIELWMNSSTIVSANKVMVGRGNGTALFWAWLS